MASTTEIKLEFPTVNIELRKEDEKYGFTWVDLPFVPSQGDTLIYEYDRYVVVRRHVQIQRDLEPIVLIVRPADEVPYA